jgi:hypothetical protein
MEKSDNKIKAEIIQCLITTIIDKKNSQDFNRYTRLYEILYYHILEGEVDPIQNKIKKANYEAIKNRDILDLAILWDELRLDDEEFIDITGNTVEEYISDPSLTAEENVIDNIRKKLSICSTLGIYDGLVAKKVINILILYLKNIKLSTIQSEVKQLPEWSRIKKSFQQKYKKEE